MCGTCGVGLVVFLGGGATFSTEQVEGWRLMWPVVGGGSVLALLLLRSEALCATDRGVLVPPPLLCCSTLMMWAVPAVVL